jgi:hypothetical protein
MKNKKFEFKNILTEKHRLDRRFYRVQMFKKYLSVILWGIIIGCLLGLFLADNPYGNELSLSRAFSQTVDNKKVVVEAKEIPFCYDVIGCIRDVGEELGMSNKDILIAINISKNESGFRADAIGKNTNGTFDIGAMQINDVHGKRISRADRLDYEKNIRFAYKLRLEQGNWNAWSTCHNGKVDCR